MIPSWRTVLDRYSASARPISEPLALGNAGGFSGASLWRFRSGLGLLGLKAWAIGGPDLESLRQIHRWLAAAQDLGFLPIPIPTMDGSTIVEADGRRWDLSPWLPGEAAHSRPPKPVQVRAMFGGLAAFHLRLASERTEGKSPGLAARFSETTRLLTSEFDQIDRAIARASDDPRATLARDWLDRARPIAPRLLGPLRTASSRVVPLQPCLRDARPDHFLFDNDRLTGLVDFGAMGRETVAGDLARLMAEALGSDRPARAVALEAYEAIRPMDVLERSLIDPFGRANALLGASRWIRWHFLENRDFDDPEAVEKGLRRGLERLDEVG
ncbi:phosphotransferase enzyme family protein [Tundrisphaera lichenicola]|uniref:phosphotransferase enzyme family protein n=1 Tax=Tundrisphaera lichenicola TaxID=2029860 RepID=UPI003EBF9FC2